MNSKTIDGVTRKLRSVLAMILNALDRDAADGKAARGEMASELRALLDAPVDPASALNRAWQAGYDTGYYAKNPAHERTAAQPQGEPVAWQYRVSAGPQTGWSLWHDGKGEEFKQSYQVETRPLYAEQPAPVAEGTTSDKYRAELYDEVWQKARQLGFGNVTEALTFLEREVGEPHAYEYEFATVIYKDGPGKFKKVITNEAPDQHEIDAGSIINVKPLYAPERRKYDDTLLPFLAMMRKELHANSDKGDREGWLKMGREAAMAEVNWHAKKLSCAMDAADLERITEHAADVANCAMMVADVCHGLPRNNCCVVG